MNTHPRFRDTPSPGHPDLERLLELLQAYQGQDAFNQYHQCHPALDRPNGARIRRRNLRAYLETFAAASYVLVGGAAAARIPRPACGASAAGRSSGKRLTGAATVCCGTPFPGTPMAIRCFPTASRARTRSIRRSRP
jgi:hypothetical protein